MKAAVIGCGAWGTALAICLCKNGHDTVLWAHSEQVAEEMQTTGVNPLLVGVQLPEQLKISCNMDCVSGCDLVVVATASLYIRSTSKAIAPYLGKDTVVASATKGIDNLKRMSQIVEEETGRTVVAITGPTHAEEVGRGMPTGCLAACGDLALAEQVQKAFISDTFRMYTNTDVVGAELGGAIKNVIALAAGVVDGLGHGDNTKALLMTRGLTEIARLGVAMGGKAETFLGLAGVGDLIVTCTSMHSRNRRAGILIGQGLSVQEAMEKVGAVVEGYYATRSVWELSKMYGVDMPIVRSAYQVLYEGKDAKQAVQALLLRPASEE